RPVRPDAEVRGLIFAKIFFPHFRMLRPPIGDRVTEEHHADGARLRASQKGFVQLVKTRPTDLRRRHGRVDARGRRLAHSWSVRGMRGECEYERYTRQNASEVTE